jgi:transketolase
VRHHPEKGAEFIRRFEGNLPQDWKISVPTFEADEKGMATRVASGEAINALAAVIPELVGGSADLTPSNNTTIKSSSAFTPENPLGKYLHFGVREHGMGGIVNGIAYHKGLIPFGATFMVFTDYMRPSIRLSALSHLHSIWVMTHDSVGLGEDGPTHQPVEHLAALRGIPGLTVIRPCDANETAAAWQYAIMNSLGPTLLALSRQPMPTLDRKIYAPAKLLEKGAYVLADLGKDDPDLILIASGSEVYLILEAGKKIAAEGYGVRVVSFPSWELFKKTGKEYQDAVLHPGVKKRIAVEMGIAQGWERWVGDQGEIISIETYGASAPYKKILAEFGFTVENIYTKAMYMLKKGK